MIREPLENRIRQHCDAGELADAATEITSPPSLSEENPSRVVEQSAKLIPAQNT